MTAEIAPITAETETITVERPVQSQVLGCQSSLPGMALIGSCAVIGVSQIGCSPDEFYPIQSVGFGRSQMP